MIGADDTVTCTKYARENNFLDKPIWMRFERLVKLKKKLLKFTNQAKLRSYRNPSKNKFGHESPLHNSHENAIKLDKNNGNTKWQDATKSEIEQQQD